MVTSASIKKQIEGHIRSFPVVKSHYSTRRRKYLSPLLSIAEMHRLYIDKYEHGADKPSVSYSCYAKVFNSKFNLGFGQPHTDTCPTCEKLKNELASSDVSRVAAIKKEQREHLHTAEQFYAQIQP